MVKATAEANFWFPSKCAREASWGELTYRADTGQSLQHMLDFIFSHLWAFAHNDSNGHF